MKKAPYTVNVSENVALVTSTWEGQERSHKEQQAYIWLPGEPWPYTFTLRFAAEVPGYDPNKDYYISNNCWTVPTSNPSNGQSRTLAGLALQKLTLVEVPANPDFASKVKP